MHANPTPPLFAAEEYDYFRKRQSKAVKLPNPARFRKLHLKTDIAITKSQELIFPRFLLSKFHRRLPSALKLCLAHFKIRSAVPLLRSPYVYLPCTIDTTCLAASRCKILMNPRENVAEQSRSLAKLRALLPPPPDFPPTKRCFWLNRYYTKNVSETRLVLLTFWSFRLFSLSYIHCSANVLNNITESCCVRVP